MGNKAAKMLGCTPRDTEVDIERTYSDTSIPRCKRGGRRGLSKKENTFYEENIQKKQNEKIKEAFAFL